MFGSCRLHCCWPRGILQDLGLGYPASKKGGGSGSGGGGGGGRGGGTGKRGVARVSGVVCKRCSRSIALFRVRNGVKTVRSLSLELTFKTFVEIFVQYFLYFFLCCKKERKKKVADFCFS